MVIPCHHSDSFIQIAKGGEADDALKRVMLDFHTTQLVAQKQALLVLLSGEHSSKHQYVTNTCGSLAMWYGGCTYATHAANCHHYTTPSDILC